MKLFFVLFFTIVFRFHEPEPKYTWKGKEVTYKQMRDSLDYEYLKFCDSLKKERLKTDKKIKSS